MVEKTLGNVVTHMKKKTQWISSLSHFLLLYKRWNLKIWFNILFYYILTWKILHDLYALKTLTTKTCSFCSEVEKSCININSSKLFCSSYSLQVICHKKQTCKLIVFTAIFVFNSSAFLSHFVARLYRSFLESKSFFFTFVIKNVLYTHVCSIKKGGFAL